MRVSIREELNQRHKTGAYQGTCERAEQRLNTISRAQAGWSCLSLEVSESCQSLALSSLRSLGLATISAARAPRNPSLQDAQRTHLS